MSIKKLCVFCLFAAFLLGFMWNSVYANSEQIIIKDTKWKEIQKYGQEWEDLDVYFVSSTWNISNYTIMDRNMWAAQVYNWKTWVNANTWSFWYHYQWWNNYWFAPCFQSWWECLWFPGGELTTKKTVDARSYLQSKFASGVFVSQYWRLTWTAELDRLWGWWWDSNNTGYTGYPDLVTFTWRQWPCPNGYYIPRGYDWTILYSWWSNSSDNLSTLKLLQDLLLPPAGYRMYFSYLGNSYRDTGPMVRDQWVRFEYWSSSAVSHNYYKAPESAYELGWNINSSLVSPVHGSSGLWNSLSLRCFKIESNNNLTINTNWGTWVVIVIDWDKIVSLWVPSKLWNDFVWWYSDSNFTKQVKTWDNAPSALYAKWKCSDWFDDLGGGNCVWVTVTFDANRWTIVDPQMVWRNHTVKEPETKLPWYKFEWWYSDKELTKKFNFKTKITSDTTLYAKRSDYIYDFDELELHFLLDNWKESHYRMMDRNLWATEVFNWNLSWVNEESYWYMYQWWNNYWFTSCDKDITAKKSMCISWEYFSDELQLTWKVVDYMPSKYADNTFRDKYWYYNWVEFEYGDDSIDNLWWWDWDRTPFKEGEGFSDYWDDYEARQWPCPEWYHVPGWWELYDFTSEWMKASNFVSWDSELLSKFYIDSLLPVHYDYVYGIWSSSPWKYTWDKNQSALLQIYPNVTMIKPRLYHRWAMWNIRCFKNPELNYGAKYDYLINIGANWGKNAVFVIHWNKLKSLWIPSKTWSIFDWWFWDSSFKKQAKVWDVINSSQNRLYAKWWECLSWYVKNQSGNCVKWPTVTFDANWWTVVTWSLTVLTWTELDLSKYEAKGEWYKFIWWSNAPTAIWPLTKNPIINSDTKLYALFEKQQSRWADLSNGDWVDNSKEETNQSYTWYNLIVNYKYDSWEEASKSTNASISNGSGFTLDPWTLLWDYMYAPLISWIVSWNDIILTVTYRPIYTLQIDYVNDRGSVAKSFKAHYISGQSYNIRSPKVQGYTTIVPYVKWKIFWTNLNIVHQVKYT